MAPILGIELQQAKEARTLYHNVGPPTVKNFKHMISTNMIANCPITIRDFDNAEKIYGPAMSALKGKSTQSKPKPVIHDEIVVPPEIYANNLELDLCIDVMFINGISFLVGIDKQVKYRSIIHIQDKNTETFYSCLDQLLCKYNSAGFTIVPIHADNEFKPLMDQVKDDL